MRMFAHIMLYFSVFMAGAWADHSVKVGYIPDGAWVSLASLGCAIVLLRLTRAPSPTQTNKEE